MPLTPFPYCLALGGTVLCLLAFCVWPANLSIPWLVIFCACIGLPHGAMDIQLAYNRLLLRNNIVSFLTYLLLYVLLAVSVWITWRAVPATATILFFLLAWSHFCGLENNGEGWQPPNTPAMLEAAFVLFVPFASKHDSAWKMVTLLAERPVPVLKPLFAMVASVVAVFIAAALAHQRNSWHEVWKHGVRLSLLAASAYLLPPLYSFAVYFLLWHAPSHLQQLSAEALTRGQLGAVAAATVVCIFAGIWIVIGARVVPFNDALVRTFFAGLASLTVPHFLNVHLVLLAERIGNGALSPGPKANESI